MPQNLIFLRPYIDAVARKEIVNSCKYHLIEEPSDIPFPELILPISSTIFHEWQIALSPRAGTLFDAMAQQDIYHWISNRLATLLTPSFYDDFNSKRTQEKLIQSYKDKKELMRLFSEKISAQEALVFSCGSGITACIVMLACEISFKKHNCVYDGSWTEWATLQGLFLKN